MPRRPTSKYRLPRSGRGRGAALGYWLLLLAILVAAIWFFWPRRRVIEPAPAQKSFVQMPLPKPAPRLPPPTVRTAKVAAVIAKPAATNSPVPAAVPPPTNGAPAAPANLKPAPVAFTVPDSTGFPRPVHDPFEAQVALARLGISPGSIDGAMGSQTRLAVREFQRASHLPETGALDAPTRNALTLDEPVLTDYTITAADLARLQPVGKTWLDKSRQTALDYETEAELVGEFSHANPALVRRLNPQVDWQNPAPGTILRVPNVQYPDPDGKATHVLIHLSAKYLEALDESNNILLHCPCSIAAHVEKRPVGLLHVVVVIPRPNYTFDPAIFPESPEAQQIGRKLVLPPGPNNPVGMAWIGLDRPGYGMHGTPAPEQVGRTESHGCFRLANWDAEYLVKLVWIGMPVEVEP